MSGRKFAVLRDAQLGTVYAEFLVAFTPFFLLFLGGVQIALIAQARVVVQHAASLAVRAAVVTIDDDPVFYDDGKRKTLSTKGTGKGAKQSQNLIERLGNQPSSSQRGDKSEGSERLNRVRNAAYLPLSAIGPSHEQVLSWFQNVLPNRAHYSLAQTVGDAPLLRVLTTLALYARVASAVTFPAALASEKLRGLEQPFRDDEVVRARVTYLFPCSVPLVRVMACRALLPLPRGDFFSSLREQFARLGSEQEKDAFKQGLEELEQAEWADMQKLLYAFPNERFLALRGEAALPNQGAAYRYPSELCKTKERAPEVDCKGKGP